jgi:monoamine oxidase
MLDILVVGGGMAGAAAALRLSDAGLGVTLVEARGRLGGRAYSRPLGEDAGDAVEFGGSWITPWHDRIRALARRVDIPLRPAVPLSERRWHDGTRLRDDAPCAAADRAELERVLAEIAQDARRAKQNPGLLGSGGAWDGMSMEDYLASKSASPAARHEIMAFWCISGSTSPDAASPVDLIHFASHHDGTLDGMLAVLTHTVEGGASALAHRLVRESGAEVIVGDPVATLDDHGSHVSARLSSGHTVKARRAILAVGVNALRTIRISPPLRPEQARLAADGHRGRAIKMLMKVEGVEPGILVTGNAGGLRWMLSERKLGQATLVIGFGLYDEVTDTSAPAIEAALQTFFPEARLLSHDWHDWVRDPWSSGTWVSVGLGASARHDPAHWTANGNIGFATSDTAPDESGWYEGAVCAGQTAAEECIAALQGKISA